ncbi:sigma-70 family RNA polymerase sigma factor [uncultured Bacteroides sp.]|uniref:RNA polymerase sigma factor n=1 Tax=uncultured Bacteroides sp. TaxID=162156 RepID=UPI002AAA62D4|nr:sigma-70 family RNA polymerase sigma factor [uncultured Bacteroides sp.]
MSNLEKYIKNPSLLWDDFRGGNEKAFSALFNIYSDPLFRYGMKFISDEGLVKDCIQELFIKLYRNHSNLSPTDNPLLYLFKSLKNRLADVLGSRNERIMYMPNEDLPFLVDYRFDPVDDQDIDEELIATFNKAMSFLTPRQKEAIYLHYQSELTYEEIAQLLNINYQSVRNLIHRAVEKIRTEMDLTVFLFLVIKFVY